MTSSQTVYIIDDDANLRESIRQLVESKGISAAAFASAEEFLNQFEPQTCGCALVDIRMCGMSGLELQETMQSRGSHMPVVLITAYGDVPSAVQAMKSGALAFIEKPCSAEVLWNYIAQALRYDLEMSQKHAEIKDVRERMATLSEDERQVLDQLMTGAPNKAIASRLDIGLRTVEARRAALLKKLRANSLAVLVRKVLLASSESAERVRD